MHGGKELLSGWQEMVDRDRVNGTLHEIAGRAQRQMGEWTDDKNDQVEGLAQEVKEKAQKTWDGVKEAVRAARDTVRKEQRENDPAAH
jgi:uncharacterized protein YjbJ (UPF0337 family)